MKLFTLFSSLITCISVYSQNILVKGILYDSDERNPVAFASIRVSGTRKVIDTDENGYFELAATRKDTLFFSCIGYEQLNFPVTEIPLSGIVFMKKLFTELKEFVVTKPVAHLYGIVSEKQDRSHIGSTQIERYEMATLIEVPKEVKLYRISKLFIKEKKFNEKHPFCLHIYSVSENNLPGEELLTKEIVCTKKIDDRDIVEIDLKNQNIVLRNTSFFVGIQWLNLAKEEKGRNNDYGIGETFKIEKTLTYRRSLLFSNNRWFIEYENSIVFPATGKEPVAGKIPAKEHPINMLASAEINEISE